MRAQLLLLAALALGSARPQAVAAQNPLAQNPAPGNPAAALPAVFTPADIAYGARLYDAQCTTCHGANGDGVGGVEFKSGKFRNAVTDQDLRRVILTGIQGTGMLAFAFDAAELDGIVAFLRNMNTFERGSVKPGDAA